ncbi:hypothetical protein Tco_0084370 [Tanacetum coccineum]
MLWEWRGIANMDFIQLGGSSRVDEMILARVRSGFAGKKQSKDIEGALEMEKTSEKPLIDSAAILHELYNEMGKLSME